LCGRVPKFSREREWYRIYLDKFFNRNVELLIELFRHGFANAGFFVPKIPSLLPREIGQPGKLPDRSNSALFENFSELHALQCTVHVALPSIMRLTLF